MPKKLMDLSGSLSKRKQLEELANNKMEDPRVIERARILIACLDKQPLEKIAADFLLPASDSRGHPLTQEELSSHIDHSFFSPALCAQYATYRDGSDRIHFVLYGNAHSIAEKIRLARSSGITRFLLPWSEISSCPEQYGLPRFTQKKS